MTPPRLLTIAGSDSGGGAGIQADLKTFAAHGAYGMSVITALTAQNTREVRAVHEVPPEMVAAQIDAVLEDIGADAIKIGMLASAGIIRVVADRLRFHLRDKKVPVVLDPVMIAKSGDRLLREDAIEALLLELLPLATLLTPNVPELEKLTGFPARNVEERLFAARGLATIGPAVLAKGGHAEGEEIV
ncbi:MAG TPA: bifunctional hydroxymethylpyrimidine kinase/phosphomethylpyrimidine kinase, partial [Thermoanaerobaculia bacterium]